MSLTRRGALIGALLLSACAATPAGTSGATSPTSPVGPTPPAIDATWVEATSGTVPLVLVAPHGGDLSPAMLPDRNCSGCTYVNDANTQELARAIADSVAARTGGRRPWLIINRLHRDKFDGNRDLTEATAGFAPLTAHWTRFHAAVDSARAAIGRTATRGLVVDLHGHGHVIQRLELGYLLSDAELRTTDAALMSANAMARSSIATTALAAGRQDSAVALLRGPLSLGAQLVAAGYPSVPSVTDPAPSATDPYFNGGFNTQRYGSAAGGPTDAVQIEHNFTGVRDTPANRARYAGALASVLVAWLNARYGWQ